ncbi:MAG TPA: polysaccharide deacetylase family protein [Verrucomicrobiae bacterium]|nr:polysaccharide deacetylase family protein [Verrucomicrobiae bacterium]
MKWLERLYVFLACALLAGVALFSYHYELERVRPLIAAELAPWNVPNWIIKTEADVPAPDLAEPPEEVLVAPTSSIRVPVLMYHRVRVPLASDTASQKLLTVTPATFEKQMQSLADGGFVPITPDDLLYAMMTSTARLPSKPVLLTFDDGYKDDFTNVLPVLERLKFQGTFYIVPAATRFGGFMSPDMITQAAQSGYVTIGSHTMHHSDLRYLSEDDRLAEIRDSRTLLQIWSGQPVDSFAYPYGFYNDAVIRDVESVGYDLAFRTGAGADHTSSTRFKLPRIQINQDTDVVKTVQRYLK